MSNFEKDALRDLEELERERLWLRWNSLIEEAVVDGGGDDRQAMWAEALHRIVQEETKVLHEAYQDDLIEWDGKLGEAYDTIRAERAKKKALRARVAELEVDDATLAKAVLDLGVRNSQLRKALDAMLAETFLDTDTKERCLVCDSGCRKDDPEGWEHRSRCPVPAARAAITHKETPDG